jgi:ABC-type dipeptide/oligopeptide/nickel transport system permease subunit
LLAPATALAATAVALLAGVAAGYRGGWVDAVLNITGDLFLSLPWLFVLLTLRALLPLDIPPITSLLVTSTLLASVGWAAGARVVRASVASLRNSGPVTQARAYGSHPVRLLLFHIVPNLRPVAIAQFWILVPVFLLTEANLGVLGLGVTEPMPSLGNMLAELQAYDRVVEEPWIVAPAVLVVATVASLHFVVPEDTTCER